MLAALLCLLLPTESGTVSGTLQPWHPITVSLQGPQTSETAATNPFTDHRLDVTFRNVGTGDIVVVPGFFAADGDAANSSADAGSVWQAKFSANRPGDWVYRVRHRTGPDAAISDDGQPGSLDGLEGEFVVAEPTAATTGLPARSFYRLGQLEYVGKRYYRTAGNQAAFLKAGIGSPENLLGYVDFDGTYKHDKQFRRVEAGVDEPRKNDNPNKGVKLHRYEPHLADWNDGDPTWGDGRGKALIGALNYAADLGLSSVYFLSMNVTGDGKDVWPWIGPGPSDRDRFDVSKLAQWDIVFSHMQRRGIVLHMLLQEQENDQLLDNGDTGRLRKLYLRELVARFGHHPGLIWNLGEENTQTAEQVQAMSAYLDRLDGYDHPRVIHTYPNKMDLVYEPLLGTEAIEGASLQVSPPTRVHEKTKEWIARSDEAGQPWVVALDEIGPAKVGVMPDADDPSHDDVRSHCLWGHFLAGGAGVEWYFGYTYPNHDLTAEDWRTRDAMWRQSVIARDFMQSLPFEQMRSADELTETRSDYVFADRGVIYAVYHPPGFFESGDSSTINLLDDDDLKTDHDFTVQWLDAKNGGPLVAGSVAMVPSGERVSIGTPPKTSGDWVAVIRMKMD